MIAGASVHSDEEHGQSIGDTAFITQSLCVSDLRRNIVGDNLEGMRVVAGSGRKSGWPLFAVIDDDDGRVRVDGPDIQRRLTDGKPGGDMQAWIHCSGSIKVL